MEAITKFSQKGKVIEDLLKLRDAPVALKVLYEGDELPEGAIRPLRDLGQHYAMCQAMTLVRKSRKTVAMLKEDNWCLWPLISYGITKLDEEDDALLGGMHFYRDTQVSCRYFRDEYPMLNSERTVIGYVMAPLSDCPFVPELVCIYCSVAQLRTLLMASKYESGEIAGSSLDTCASCVHGQIPVLRGEMAYNLSIPDPGEYERGLCDENDMIFNVSGDRVEELTRGLQSLKDIGFGYGQLHMDMNLDYARPKFYNSMFEKWGLDSGEEWAPRV